VSRWQAGRITEAVADFDLATVLLDRAEAPTVGFEHRQRLACHTFRAATHALHGDWSDEQVARTFAALLDSWPPLAAPAICGMAALSAAVVGRWDLHELALARVDSSGPAAEVGFWGAQFAMHRAVGTARAGRAEDAVDAFSRASAAYTDLGAHTYLAALQGRAGHRLGRRGPARSGRAAGRTGPAGAGRHR
jgi:hypothetical protein